ncbi:CoA transferase [Gordonia amarae]|mgnify:CR=1 FL=1|uniref:CaiB/BaiF family protein n=2 Tax=Gordonia amarae TaxID=36821 RepID=G7GMC8_9ACTN|nr:CoA transferase [Gordonia amarae]MCS3880681.1 crotonobetainyl-CoA:carnitine CoA-transferase CaiB-like acyl-CoA transferase [Gordonia amarae]QHN18978.1 CoA transferase [Gordonia amarae]QHN23453.1 CoA transferase [Gordonia amarae]QHN32353.1 CoA transferase [Gordonia amarae]QHN41101.1 CoA transferase [Gordonia amarae]
MTAVMKGVRIVEVAEQAFGPAACALLSDWGADVIKIEPVEKGDAGRGLRALGNDDVLPLFESNNRGKRSLGLDLSTEEGQDILYRLVADADIFVTNKVPRVRKRLNIDVDDIRRCNPNIIYARATGNGERGPEADNGSYDLLGFWYRTGAALGAAPAGSPPPYLPSPGFGDLIGATTIAAGLMGALYHRATTGEAPVVDVSLLATGMWAMSGSISSAALTREWSWPPPARNPLSHTYETADHRWIGLCCLQPASYWAPLCEVLGRPDLITDPRFADFGSLMANAGQVMDILAGIFAKEKLEHWRTVLADFKGQWTVIQDPVQVLDDPQVAANGLVQTCTTEAGVPFDLVTAPVQYDGQPAVARRGPGLSEHGDAILSDLGYDWDTVVDLKVRGVVA